MLANLLELKTKGGLWNKLAKISLLELNNLFLISAGSYQLPEGLQADPPPPSTGSHIVGKCDQAKKYLYVSCIKFDPHSRVRQQFRRSYDGEVL